MSVPEEKWAPVEGYELGYEVSNLGNVRSLYRSKKHLSPGNSRGYRQVVLYSDNGKSMKHHSVHRLVAKAFIPNPYDLPWVNHLNGVKHDNRVENLEWCDRAGNVKHAVENGLLKPKIGEENGNSKFTDRERKVIMRLSDIGFSQYAIADMFESQQGTIQKIISSEKSKRMVDSKGND